MARSLWLSIIMLGATASASRAVIHVMIYDPVDDLALVDAVSGQKPVKEFAAEVEAWKDGLLAHDKEKLEKLFGQPVPGLGGTFAIPVGHPRGYAISGIRYADPKLNKDHTAYYPIGDFAGIEVWYGIDGTSRQFAVLYFKVDDAFPRLKEDGVLPTLKTVAGGGPRFGLAVGLAAAVIALGVRAILKCAGRTPGVVAVAALLWVVVLAVFAVVKFNPATPAVIRKDTIDVGHWERMEPGMTKEQIARLFSAPPGDYAAGTDYLTRCWGWRRGGDGKAHETLEWRSAEGRIVVEFDEQGNFVASEFYRPGRDPVTNVAERLKWDRETFDKVKKYVEKRKAAK